MTEEDAKQRWCPYVRAAATSPEGVVVALNRHGPGQLPPELRCLGSGCMMWVPSGIVYSGESSVGDCGLKRSSSGSAQRVF